VYWTRMAWDTVQFRAVMSNVGFFERPGTSVTECLMKWRTRSETNRERNLSERFLFRLCNFVCGTYPVKS
jgi:hypothetical protein